MTLTVWLGFLLAAILIAVTPGPGAVISMSTGMRHGYLAALTAILGLQAAILLHLMIVALGLGALLAASETAFALVKFVGAAYLVWLGIQKWRAAPVPVDVNAPPVRRKVCFEAVERLRADGSVETPLDETKVKAELSRRYPRHEWR